MPAGRPRTRNEGDICEDCGVNSVRFKGYHLNGEPRWDKRCVPCHKGQYDFPWLQHRADECEICGYHPFFRRALQVHHRDEDKSNNEPENLMTVCSNCHAELHGFLFEVGDYKKAESMLRKFIKALLN